MTTRPNREQLEARRRELRERAVSAAQRVRDTLDQRQQQRRQQQTQRVQENKKRKLERRLIRRPPKQEELLRQLRMRRLGRLGLLLVCATIILWLLARCDDEPPAPTPVELTCEESQPCEPAVKAPQKPRPRNAKLVGDDRDRIGLARASAPSWLSAFRFQVSARSPLIARCFDDATAPGLLRLSTTVAPRLGTLSGSVLEPMGERTELSAAQQRCVLDALDPPYRLEPGPDDELGTRVTLVIEF
ncbi:MAG: hypothetical protein ACO3JL_04580 [Myxococcota bacterium]